MICVSISEKNIEVAEQIIQNAELAEIRLDLTLWNMDQTRELCTKYSNLLITYRPGAISEDDRAKQLIAAIEAGARYVDIEYESDLEFKSKVIEAAKNSSCDIIISYHNYDITPDRDTLQKIIEECFSMGADVAKIATTTQSIMDVSNILGLYNQKKRLVCLGMGSLGKTTRVLAPLLGAEFTFASIDNERSTAPGQISKQEMAEHINYIKNQLLK